MPNPLPWEQPAAAQTAPISLPRSGTYWTTPFVPGGTPTRPTRKVDLRVYPKKATLQTPQGKFDLSYIGIKYGGSYYNIVGMNPRQNMIFVERYTGALEYDVYYEKVGDSKLLEETWTPAN